jgi:hypothetical protein
VGSKSDHFDLLFGGYFRIHFSSRAERSKRIQSRSIQISLEEHKRVCNFRNTLASSRLGFRFQEEHLLDFIFQGSFAQPAMQPLLKLAVSFSQPESSQEAVQLSLLKFVSQICATVSVSHISPSAFKWEPDH